MERRYVPFTGSANQPVYELINQLTGIESLPRNTDTEHGTKNNIISTKNA
jgi:hypothetical protein